MNRRIQYTEKYLESLMEKHKNNPIAFEYTLASELLEAAKENGYGVDLNIRVLHSPDDTDRFQVIK